MRRVTAVALLALVTLGGTGCPTVDVGETPVSPPPCRPSFAQFRDPGGIWDVAINPPDMAKSCVSMDGCHTSATGRSALRLITKDRSLMTDNDWQFNYDVVTRFLNCSDPENSLLIRKPTVGLDPHLGGDIWTCTGVPCEPQDTIITWIESR